jgi:hypothetical protein
MEVTEQAITSKRHPKSLLGIELTKQDQVNSVPFCIEKRLFFVATKKSVGQKSVEKKNVVHSHYYGSSASSMDECDVQPAR